MDIVLIITLAIIIELGIAKARPGAKTFSAGSFLGAVLVALLLLGITRWLILGLLTGFSIPQASTPAAYRDSGLLAVGIWAFLLLCRPLMYFRRWITKNPNIS